MLNSKPHAWGGFAFGVALNLACLIPGASFFAPMLVGAGWFFGVSWAILNFAQALRVRDGWGLTLAALGVIFDCLPFLWFRR